MISIASTLQPFSIPSSMETDEYLKLAEVEDRMWYFRSLHGRLHEAVDKGLNLSRSIHLLDAGCGTGGFLQRLRAWEPQWQTRGLDLSPLACELARKRGHEVSEGSVTALPFQNEAFDAITCGDVLYHLLEHGKALEEFRRCLRRGGIVAINVPAYRWLWSYHDERVHSKHRFTRRELFDLVRRAGLSPVFSTYWNTIAFPLIVIRRKIFPPRTEESDVKLSSPPVEALFNCAMAVERAWNRAGLILPFGSSVFLVGRKDS